MALLAAVFMFTITIAAVVIVIISDNKKKQIETKNKSSELLQEETRVYDGIPIAKCHLCGGRGVVVHKIKGKDIFFNARCRDCGRTLFKDDGGPDLGYVLTEWNNWNESTDASSYRYDYTDDGGKGKNGWNPKMHKPITLRY